MRHFNPHRFFTIFRFTFLTLIFTLVMSVMHGLAGYVCENVVAFDCPFFYPISLMFVPRFLVLRPVIALVAAAIFVLVLWWLRRNDYGIRQVIAAAMIIALSTTAIQGWDWGFAAPIATGLDDGGVQIPISETGTQYYHNIGKVDGVLDFIRDYETLHPDLTWHAKIHPPGAVLLYSQLLGLVPSLHLVTVLMGVFSIGVSGVCLYLLLRDHWEDESAASKATLVFLLIPAVQIFGVASLDGVTLALILTFLYGYLYRQPGWRQLALALGAFFLATFINYAVWFIVPVVAGYDLFYRRHVRYTLLLLAVMAGLYGLLAVVTGFNYAHAFTLALETENGSVYKVFQGILPYLFTRLESFLDVVVYAGPVMTALVLIGGRVMWHERRPLLIVSGLTLLGFIGALTIGLYRTGETSRVLLFLYPLLLLPALYVLRRYPLKDRHITLLMSWVFLQTWGMQLIGYFVW